MIWGLPCPRREVVHALRQLTITSAQVDIVPPTMAGSNPLDLDEQGQYRSARRVMYVLGLSLLSEPWVKKESHDGSDLAWTWQLTGARRGVLHPQPRLLLSPRLYQLLRELKVGRLVVEVAPAPDGDSGTHGSHAAVERRDFPYKVGQPNGTMHLL